MTSNEQPSAHRVQPDMHESNSEEPAPAPVFVDQTGLRGRLLRGLGWPVSVVGAVLAAAMAGSLIGVQSDAPAMGIPAQPSLSPTLSPSLPPVPSPTPSIPSSAPPTATRSAPPRARSSATTSKPTTTTSKPTTPKPTTSKPTTSTPHRATPPGLPTKHA
ncbi:hypothetical protein [Kitasatospora sp. McL0602]|uniref:hypothetical protein n=1 Tax=Kitasatospora sp. McL0602 TaxID=3439530 RepID=UPI003F8CAF5A